jgi:hypothetical protein
MAGDGVLSTEAPPNSAGGIAATRFPTIQLESVSDRSLGQVHSHAPGIQEEAQTCVRRVQARDVPTRHHLMSYAVASYSCRIAFCSCVGLTAWRGDKLQQSDATRYDAYRISFLKHDKAPPV